MEINKFIPEGGEKLNREDVKVSVFHLFGVGLEASVDYEGSRHIKSKRYKKYS